MLHTYHKHHGLEHDHGFCENGLSHQCYQNIHRNYKMECNRQTNCACKYSQSHKVRQSQLFTVLEKYLLPDNLENLQSQFGFLKQATSKNIKHLQQAINVQQTCTATLCIYINNILPCITKLEATILQLQQKITTEQDTVQINALDFDLDIDGSNPPRTHNNTVITSVLEHLTSPEPEVSDVAEFQEEDTARDSPDFIYNISEEFHGYDKSLQDTALIQKKYLS